MNAKKLAPALVMLTAVAALLPACASMPQQEEMKSMARVFNRPYDQVWESVTDLLHNDLKCAFKKNDKRDGVLETEWVHRMDTEGRKRWMLIANMREVKNGVEVVLYKKVEFQDDVSKSLEKYNRKKDTVQTANSGWRKTAIDLTAVGDLYRSLEHKLEN